jgi:hypothetical protein
MSKFLFEEELMKRTLTVVLAILCCFVFTQDLNSQVKKKKRIKKGAKIAPQITKIPRLNGLILTPMPIPRMRAAGGSRDYSPSLGWAFGPFLESQEAENVAIELDVLYSRKGTKSSDPKLKLRIDYIEIPLLLKFQLASGAKLIPALFAGPYFAFRVTPNDKVLIVADGVPLEGIDPKVKNVDFGITFGGGVHIGKYSIEARCNWGLTKIIEGSEARNLTFALMVGFDVL